MGMMRRPSAALIQRKLAASVVKRRPAATMVKTKKPAAAHAIPRGAAGIKADPKTLTAGGSSLRTLKTKEIAELIESSTPYEASMRPAAPAKAALRVISWNVNGFAALVKSHPTALQDLAAAENPDVIVLQETKLQAGNVESFKQYLPPGWCSEWACSTQTLGYAGVAALWPPKAALSAAVGVGLPEADSEGRCVTVELPRFYVVGCYVPNAGEGLKRLDFRIKKWEPAIARHIAKLQAKKPVVYCGDLNVCHQEIDLWGNHGPNSKGAGYTPEERQAMSKLLDGNRFVDSFRHKHPNVRAFTYWSYRFNARAKNQGWRLDYCLVPEALKARVHDAYIMSDVRGSDHCPVGVVIT